MPVNLALEELLTNVVMHAEAARGCAIRIRLCVDDDALTAELSDDARPFDPLTMPPPDTSAPLEERSVGGLGIHLVRSLMVEVRYRRTDDRNHTVLVKRRPGA